MYKKDDMMFKPNVKTIQLVWNSTDAIANDGDGTCNFQLPVQGYYDVLLKDVQATFLASQVTLYKMSSPQLRTNYTCSTTNGTDNKQTTSVISQPLFNSYIISNRQSANSLTAPILFPRCLLQNTIQIKMTKFDTNNPNQVPLPANHTVILLIELHECKNVFDTKSSLLL